MNELLSNINAISTNEFTKRSKNIYYSEKIEELVNTIEPEIKEIIPDINSRWLSLRLIDQDESIFESMNNYLTSETIESINKLKEMNLQR